MPILETRNPFTQESTGLYELESFQTVEDKVKKLKTLQSEWRTVPVDEKIKLVEKGLKYFKENCLQIAKDISEQMGRPMHQAQGEIKGMLERANYLCSIAEQTLRPDYHLERPGFKRSIEHIPLGTIFVISAWNYPLLITVNSVIPALLSGNTVLLKHSSITPKVGIHFERAFYRLGDHQGLLRSIVVDHATTGQVIEKSDVDHVVFTGSVSGGRKILAHTSKRFMQPALELGGKDAAYIHSDANLDHAVESVVDGAMFNSGQSCCGIERAYVHESIYDTFIEKAKYILESYKLGDPADMNTTLGPLATPMAAEYMQKQIDDAKGKGAKIVTGGSSIKIEKGTFFLPTLLCDVDHSMEVMKEENFGPIIPVMKVNDENEAVGLINDSDYGLTCALFTAHVDLAKGMADSLNTGTVFMNRCDYLDPALPWTGVKNSGCGSALSKYGFYTVTRRKSLHFKLNT